MQVTKNLLIRLINEAYGDMVKPGPFGEWLKRIGALDDHPDFDIETWNRIGRMLTSGDEDYVEQGRAILDAFGFDDWEWLNDVISSWEQATSALDIKTYGLEPDDPMYDITYDMGSYGGDISRLVSQGDSEQYLSKLMSKLQPLAKKYNLEIPRVQGWFGTDSDPTAYIMLKEPYIGLQIAHFGGGGGPPEVSAFGWEDENTSNEFIDWFINNFEQSELTGNLERDTKHVTELINNFRQFSALNSVKKQMIFLRNPRLSSKILNLKKGIGLEE